ncbi:Kelch repeat-containing protein [Chryseobacterium sp. JK1]|uniref:Kelch repeat-containing protein n=1 Tax=Chryseobacterium sp. JK1 TaxID=874294 RepID=UPI003D694539
MKTKLLFLSVIGSFLAHAQALDFQKLKDMPTGRGGITSVLVNNNIYVTNGYTANGVTNYIEKYNINDNKWSVLNSTLVPKKFANSVAFNNKIYIFNGLNNKHLEILDLASNTVTRGADNPFYAGSSGSDIYDAKIYVFGGSGLKGAANTVYSNKFQYYDIASDTWHSLPDMPTAKETKGKIVNDKLYVIGGFNGSSSNLIDVYDLTSNRWTNQYTMPDGVSGHSLTVEGNKIFIIGSYNNQTFLAYFDTTTNELHELSSNMIPRRHSAAEIYDHKLYIIGGSSTSVITSAIGSTQVADINDSILAANVPPENKVQKAKVYTNANKDGFVISNKNSSNQFEYTVLSLDGTVLKKGVAYYNNNIDLSRVQKGTYIFTYKDEKGILQKVKVMR